MAVKLSKPTNVTLYGYQVALVLFCWFSSYFSASFISFLVVFNNASVALRILSPKLETLGFVIGKEIVGILLLLLSEEALLFGIVGLLGTAEDVVF